MKLLLACLILVIFLQNSIQAFRFNPFHKFVTTTRNPPTTTPTGQDNDYCYNKKRTWTACMGSPPMRFTTDRCKRRNVTCGTGEFLGNAFVQSFLAPTLSSSNTNYHSRGPVNTGPPRCDRGPSISNASLGNCNVRSRTKRQVSGTPLPVFPKRDIMILMDESGSVGSVKFDKVKQIASAIAKLLCGDQRIALHKTRIGVTSFDSQIHPHIILEETDPARQYLNWDADLIADEISSIAYNSNTHGSTCLYRALEYTHSTSFLEGGRRNDPDVVQEIILITDGCANCGGDLEQMRDTLVAAGTSVYVIGVNLNNTCQNEIMILAQGGNCYHFFFMDFWGTEFNEFIQYLLDEAQTPSGNCILGQLYSADQSSGSMCG